MLVLLIDGCYEGEGLIPEDFRCEIQETLEDNPTAIIQILNVVAEGSPQEVLNALGPEEGSEEE